MKLKAKIFLSAAIVVLLVFGTIFLITQGEKQEVKNLVITYNDLLRKAHTEMKPSHVRKLTSDWQYKKIDSYIALNIKNRRIIDGELKDMQFEDISVEKDTAMVITKERWVWKFIDPVSKNAISETYDDLNRNTYHLKKIKGHWVIDDLVSNIIKKAEE
jgi:hypothetical protein